MIFKAPNLKSSKLAVLAAPLAFFLFTFVTAILVVHFVIQERQSVRSMESLQVGMDLVSERFTHLKQRLAMDLSAELMRRKSSSTAENEHLSFSSVGVLKIKNSSLQLEWMANQSDASPIKAATIEEWFREVDPDVLQEKGSLFFIADEHSTNPYLISILPFQLGDSKAAGWGFAAEALPSDWLSFPRSNPLWIVDDESKVALSSFGGQHQGVNFEQKLKNLSESVANYQVADGEVWAWQKLKGSNLVVLWRQASSSWFTISLWWLLFGAVFALGLIPFLKITERTMPLNALAAEPEQKAPKEVPSVVHKVAPALLKETAYQLEDSTPMSESLVEESLLESMLEPLVIDEGKPSTIPEEPVSGFNEMVSDALKNQSAAIQSSGIRVNLLLEPNLQTEWPLTQLQSALEEILKNSIESMESSEVKTLTLSGHQKDDVIDLCIEDTGVGMTDEILARSMEAFFSTKPSGSRRRGLGLNVAKRLLEISGGRIKIESTPGVGTKVHFEIPNEPTDEVRTSKTFDAPVIRPPAVRV